MIRIRFVSEIPASVLQRMVYNGVIKCWQVPQGVCESKFIWGVWLGSKIYVVRGESQWLVLLHELLHVVAGMLGDIEFLHKFIEQHCLFAHWRMRHMRSWWVCKKPLRFLEKTFCHHLYSIDYGQGFYRQCEKCRKEIIDRSKE